MKRVLMFIIASVLVIAGCSTGGGQPEQGGVSPEGHYYLGPEDAKVVIENFSDFQ